MLDHRIQTFLTLCETMNYRAAAEQLHITQPAVTQHIQYLEQLYGCRFFVYDGRSLKKTDQAEIFLRTACAMHYQEENLRRALKPYKGNTLTIGATKTIGEFVIADQVARYLAEKENHLTVDIDNTEHIMARLDRGELDFALIEGFFNRSAYGSRLYREEPFVGLCSKTHPLAHETVSLERLKEQNLILREEESGTRQILEQLLTQHNWSVEDFSRVTCVSNFGLLARLTAAGCGITFAYAAVSEGNDGLARFYVEGWNVMREFNYVYLPGSGMEEAVELFEQYR